MPLLAADLPDGPGEASEPVLLSLVIPCLNEADAIGRVVRKARDGLAQLGLPGEVLVVDNGSTDGSVEEARRAGARVIRELARGYGNALRRGFAEARGEYIVMADGDDTYPVDQLQPFIDLLDNGYDLVCGNRFGGKIEPGAMPWTHRYLGTPVLSWLVRWLSGTKVGDSQCGMRAFRRDALEQLDLRAPGMELATEMLVEAGRARLRIGEVPVSLGQRVGESKLETVPDGWRHLRYLLVASPDHLFLLPGMALVALGLAMLVLQALLPLGVWVGPAGWVPQYASVILGSVGAQVVWFGLLAKLYYARTGLTDEGHVARWFLNSFSLEQALAASLAVLASGVFLEVALVAQQVGLIEVRPALAAAGAFTIIVGLQSFFGSFLAYLVIHQEPHRRATAAYPEVSGARPGGSRRSDFGRRPQSGP